MKKGSERSTAVASSLRPALTFLFHFLVDFTTAVQLATTNCLGGARGGATRAAQDIV